MKKYFIILFVIIFICTACFSKKRVDINTSQNKSNDVNMSDKRDRSAKDLLNQYVNSLMSEDGKGYKELFPNFVTSFVPSAFSFESLNNRYNTYVENYGNDFKVTYEIISEKELTSEEFSKYNNRIKGIFKESVGYNKCYKIDGTIKFAGSLLTTEEPINLYRCFYNDKVYLAFSVE